MIYPTHYPADDFDAALSGYVECALWSSSCNGQAEHDDCRGEDCDASLEYLNLDADDLPDETRASMWADLADFVNGALETDALIFEGIDPEQVGHDFWLTRNHHGAGFWDRGLGTRGETLTKMCDPYGDSDLYVGDDGKVYVS
jgi:hypothetical protein